MCGISGIIAGKGNLFRNSAIADMNDLIYHRGPDDEGFLFVSGSNECITAGGMSTPNDVWDTRTGYHPEVEISKIKDQTSQLALGHRRLSILDLSPSGHQPMSYMEGKYWIVFNGEIYNYQDINRELVNLGYKFRTRSDTETLLAAYAEWGEACLSKMAGMWAFVIFDRAKNEIFMARDRYGIKPLYYYFTSDGNLCFSSEIKQFTSLEGWQPKMNQQRVYDQLIYTYTDHTDETMFNGVFQLPSGCFYRSSTHNIKPSASGKLEYKRWYTVKYDPFKGSFSEAAETFRNLFERSVKEHLHADVPVGTALSGGLDSSSIVCEVNRILQSIGAEELQKTFSSCAHDERFSEKKWMDIIIAHTKVNASFIYPGFNELFSTTRDLIWFHDEPYQSQSAYLAFNVFRLARANGVIVLLNGQGADEYLGGYGQFTVPRYASMLKQLKFRALLSDMKESRRVNNMPYSTILKNVAGHLIPDLMKRSLSQISSGSDYVKNIIDVKKLNPDAVHPHDAIPVVYRTVPEVSEHLTFYSTLPKYLRWEDRNSMAHSVEARVPFLDHRLVEFAYNLPDDYLEKDGVAKRVMREAMSGLLPEPVKNRRDKMGFATPEEIWVKKEAPHLFREKIAEAVGITGGLIKPEALNYFDKVVNGSLPFDYTYWRLILFSEWVRRFEIKL
jgi:asparagine synthase (glutamine-hydrolysing)